MTTITVSPPAPAPASPARSTVRARRAGFLGDLFSVAGRALRSILREPEFIAPALVIPLFFFFVNTAALSGLTASAAPGFDYEAFVLPACIIFGVTGISRAGVVVTDIQDGYLDRLLLTPVRRLTLLLGMMVADVVLVSALTIPVIAVGLLLGVEFQTGLLGILGFIALSAAWGLVFTGFPYAIALKTGNPAAVNSSFLLFFPSPSSLRRSCPAKRSAVGWTRWRDGTPSPTCWKACVPWSPTGGTGAPWARRRRRSPSSAW
ncbi:MAG: ABC transporter permease [Actinomycetota bacterium]|nr:ABC transporter permease [Actinomycetota bacterium]